MSISFIRRNYDYEDTYLLGQNGVTYTHSSCCIKFVGLLGPWNMTRDLLGHGFRIRKSSETTTEKGSCCLPRVRFASLAADGWMRRVRISLRNAMSVLPHPQITRSGKFHYLGLSLSVVRFREKYKRVAKID